MHCRIYFALLCEILYVTEASFLLYHLHCHQYHILFPFSLFLFLSLSLLRMEFYLLNLLFISLALLVCIFVGRVVSIGPAANGMKATKNKKAVSDCESEFEMKIHECQSEKPIGFVSKVEKIDEFKSELVRESFNCQEITTDEIHRLLGQIHENLKTDMKQESYSGEYGDCEDKLVDESSLKDYCRETEVELNNDEVGVLKCEEIEVIKGDNSNNEVDKAEENRVNDGNEGLFTDEDDWEGIERTELERLFGAAVAYVGSLNNADTALHLSKDVKLKLHGLHKIATQGPCQEPQPIVFKFYARAKWQKLREMNPEVAMEHYVSLLSENIPKWMQNEIHDNIKKEFSDDVAFGKVEFVRNTVVKNQADNGVIEDKE